MCKKQREEKLLEEFKNIYESLEGKEGLNFSSEEERQNFTVEKLSVEVAVDKERFTAEPEAPAPSRK